MRLFCRCLKPWSPWTKDIARLERRLGHSRSEQYPKDDLTQFFAILPSTLREAMMIAAGKTEGYTPAGRAASWAMCETELSPLADFLLKEKILTFEKRRRLIESILRINHHIPCLYYSLEIITFIRESLRLSASVPGCLVEAGAYKGGSAAKLSLAAGLSGRTLYVFDSFSGMPETASDRLLDGHPISWKRTDLCGTRDEVYANLKRFGRIEHCRLVPGPFARTMPDFHEPIAAIFMDVDLARSTRTCLRHLYPLLIPGGFVISHDGGFRGVTRLLKDGGFWERGLGCAKPAIQTLQHRHKALSSRIKPILMIRKPS